MIQIAETTVDGWETAIRGMRNPLNSWNRSDSDFCFNKGCGKICEGCLDQHFAVGKADLDLMYRLRNAGTDHRKFMRMIVVSCDITAPLYWWKEFDTYKIGTVANSCSTMHKIHSKEFSMSDFSHEHLIAVGTDEKNAIDCMENVILCLNYFRKRFVETKSKEYWWQMIQLLPSSYNQKRTILMNYEVLANMYSSRKAHKLDEWRCFCEWVKELPHSWLITGDSNE